MTIKTHDARPNAMAEGFRVSERERRPAEPPYRSPRRTPLSKRKRIRIPTAFESPPRNASRNPLPFLEVPQAFDDLIQQTADMAGVHAARRNGIG
ncbi:hypothetical protein KZW95_04570 [Slackia exigua]|nr:hypothetical protein [Slackia exigua]